MPDASGEFVKCLRIKHIACIMELTRYSFVAVHETTADDYDYSNLSIGEPGCAE